MVQTIRSEHYQLTNLNNTMENETPTIPEAEVVIATTETPEEETVVTPEEKTTTPEETETVEETVVSEEVAPVEETQPEVV